LSCAGPSDYSARKTCIGSIVAARKAAVTMDTRIHDSPTTYLHSSSAVVVDFFAGIALVLSLVGLYGVTAYSISQRTREIGIRMAVGSTRGGIYALAVRETGVVIVAGVAIGLLLSGLTSQLIRSMLYNVGIWDPLTLCCVTILLVCTALSASLSPWFRIRYGIGNRR
jgi:macrolide transport system ATP-binding/permease protein